MRYAQVIIVGGGPAGSACGWKLGQQGIDSLILDKREFPRTKLCAGWITPQVIDDLKIDIENYPHSLTTFHEFRVHIYGRELKLPVNQYAIRRHEFDHWLLKRCGVPVETHEVADIQRDGEYYVIDDTYYCRYLVGAGGTHCPVYRTLFRHRTPRARELSIVTLEAEFPYDYHDGNCHLWFLQNRLPGYSWYVPKSTGYVNIGIGGFSEKLKANNDTIKKQWDLFVKELERLSLVTDRRCNAGGYVYYIRDSMDRVHDDRAYIIGDAAGLATRDMGEGIGPAVRSGILAADAIASGNPLSVSPIKKYSFPRYKTGIKLFIAYLGSGLTY